MCTDPAGNQTRSPCSTLPCSALSERLHKQFITQIKYMVGKRYFPGFRILYTMFLPHKTRPISCLNQTDIYHKGIYTHSKAEDTHNPWENNTELTSRAAIKGEKENPVERGVWGADGVYNQH